MPADRERESLMAARRCDLCRDVEMTLEPLYEGSQDDCWYCPCCRSRLRTVEMIQASWERRASEKGMTWDEYEAHMNAEAEKYVAKPTEGDLAAVRSFVAREAEKWKPICRHDTHNPWAAS